MRFCADEFDNQLRSLLSPYPLRNVKEKLGHSSCP
jgi:hypothetical protein